ncbi:hypothetical protein F4808DRAFT_448585 [Astrocystis sublimbata]|nr:hypothetical protein F4808DRAFT_448585 [Astrocystis sublimbata]
MSSYDTYDVPPRERHHHQSRRYYDDRHDRDRERAEPRIVETQDTYYRVNPRTALVPREREDSDFSIEEVRRDFPPPGYSRDIRRARSAEPTHDDYYHDQRRGYDKAPSHGRRPGSLYYEEEERTRKRVLGKQEKILAAVAGGILAAGAKEVWDRREAKQEGADVHRNVAASAALGAVGALAGYQGAEFYDKHQSKEDKKSTYIVHKGRDGRTVEYYSDEDEDPRSHKGNKSFIENALSAAGLGGAIKALTGGDDKDSRHDARSRRGSPDSRRSRETTRDTPSARMQKAAKASLIAGAAEAFRVAKEPGGWKGEKMKRVITAAAGAATIDAAHDPTKDGSRHLVESVIGGLVGNRVLNGSRKGIEEDRSTGRSRSRSRARSGSRGAGPGIAALATAGLGALGAKKFAENRSRSRSRAASDYSYDSRDDDDRRKRSRSRSVVDVARRSLAKLGLGNDPDERRDDRRDDRSYDDASSRGSRRRANDRYDDLPREGGRRGDQYDDDYYMRGGQGPEDDYYDDRSRGGRSRDRSQSRGGRSSSVSSSDVGDSDTDRKTTSKMRRKQFITAGLATVATIHAAHNVYSSMEKRNLRHKAVAEGKLSPAEAKKLKTKAIMQDAASVGIAALGIKGAFSEVKEAKEMSKSVKEWKEQKERRHEKRVERLKRANNDHYGRSRSDGWATSSSPQDRRYDAPRYSDGNPYAATLPAPPMGYNGR